MKQDPDHIPDKWRRIIQRVARGEDWVPAARAEGCSPSYARVIHTRMMKNSAVVGELDAIRRDVRREAVYGVVEAMAQAQKGIDLAERHKNPMAYIKGCELRAKLSGLLIDRVVVETVDLAGSLAAARTRVLTVLDSTPQRQPCVELGPEADRPATLDRAHTTGRSARELRREGRAGMSTIHKLTVRVLHRQLARGYWVPAIAVSSGDSGDAGPTVSLDAVSI